AAILYRDRVHDNRAAAGLFEQAGDFDEAVRLYRLTEQYDKAGDLFRRLGDEDRAIEAYQLAAAKLVRQGQRLAAGDLLRDRAGRTDLARDCYRDGWDGGEPGAHQFAGRLFDLHLEAKEY